jgi:hypothetical protein
MIAIAIQLTAGVSPLTTSDVVAVVHRIRRADYEGNRELLKQLRDDLKPVAGDGHLASRVQYWRGFAAWRRALNGFNEGADTEDLRQDLVSCESDFRAALGTDPAFDDARAALASCLVNRSFLLMSTDRAEARTLYEQSRTLLNEALASSSDNSRVLWVYGANQFYAPGNTGQAAALETYRRALTLSRAQIGRSFDALEPSWGEPELLMNLAFANFRKTPADLEAAARYAEEALVLVPYWHYVRDILRPAILKAKQTPRQ